MYRSHVLVCGGTGCTSSGSETLISLLQEELKKNGLENEVAIVKTGCHGLCAQGPVMVIYPDAIFYSMVKPEDIPEIVSEHLLKGGRVDRLLYNENEAKYKTMASLPSWAKAPVEQVYRELGLAGTGGPGQNTQLDASETYIRALTVIAKVLEKLDAQP